MNRVGSGSSASLFFGPSISPDVPTRTKTKGSASPVPALRIPHPVVKTRHSYSGIGGECKTWNTIQARANSPSPDSSPARLSFQQPRRSSVDNDEDMFFGGGLHNSSFQLCVTKGTPSPRSRRLDPGTLQRKYRPRDSGVVISDDDDVSSLTSSSNGDHLNIVPPASMSAGSLYSDADDGLVTPGVAPESGSGWPGSAIFVRGTDENSLRNSMDGRDADVNVDEFIMRTLSTAFKNNSEGTKRAPGTPVKKQKTTFLGIDRPWQSAMAPKVGLRYQLDNRTAKAPRKSLPAVFPDFSRRLEDETDSEQEDDSPIARRDKYSGLGLGRPQPPLLREGHPARTRLLMRRTSSGAFSSGSDTASMLGTPTRTKVDGTLLAFPPPPSLQTYFDANTRSR
jgi:mitosis inhibitor protein kinase SWE1